MKKYIILFLGLLTTNRILAQDAKPLLSDLTAQLVANKVCECLKIESSESKNIDKIKKCYIEAIVAESKLISQELGINIIASNDLEMGKKLGVEVATKLLKSCPLYADMIEKSVTQGLLEKAEKLKSEQKYGEALKLYNQVFSADLNIDKSVLNARGLCKYELGDYYGALADYEYAIQLDSLYAVAYSNRGLAKSKLEKASDALDDYNKAVKLDSTNVTFLGNRGILYFENEYYIDAEIDFEKAIRLSKEPDAGYYYYLAQTRRYSKKMDAETQKLYDKAVSLEPQNTAYLNNRGLFYLDKNEVYKSKADFLGVIQLDKDYNAAYYNLSLLLKDSKQYDEALKYINEAIRIDSTYAIYHQMKGQILTKKNNFNSALSELNIAIELNEKKAEFYDDRAEVFEKQGKNNMAIKDLTSSIEIYNQDGKIYYRRGIVFLKSKNKTAACQDFQMGRMLKDEKAIQALKINCK